MARAKAIRITKAGPDPVKKYSYLDADVARQWDPQIAALYHDQMVNKGKHHTQAVCACATHLLDRVRVILLEDRPPEKVRRRNNKRARRERAERRAERKDKRRRSRSR